MAREEIETIVARVSERVREALGDAERRAGEIVAEAEDRAREIVREAEEDAERIRSAAERQEETPTEVLPAPVAGGQRPSTDELVAQLKAGAAGKDSTGGNAGAATGAGGSDAGDLAGSGASGAGGRGGDAAARLVAMNMALDGASREDVARRLADEFDVADRDALVDDVFARIGK